MGTVFISTEKHREAPTGRAPLTEGRPPWHAILLRNRSGPRRPCRSVSSSVSSRPCISVIAVVGRPRALPVRAGGAASIPLAPRPPPTPPGTGRLFRGHSTPCNECGSNGDSGCPKAGLDNCRRRSIIDKSIVDGTEISGARETETHASWERETPRSTRGLRTIVPAGGWGGMGLWRRGSAPVRQTGGQRFKSAQVHADVCSTAREAEEGRPPDSQSGRPGSTPGRATRL